jgi:hypothetical protein
MGMSKKESGEQPVESSTESRAVFSETFRSLSGATSEPMPLQHGDPQPGGLRPGPDTGHTPQSAAPEVTPSSSPSTDSPAASDS